MTDFKLDAEKGNYPVTGADAGGRATRSAESWQFFAFMFAAAITFVFALMDEIEIESWEDRLTMKIFSFFALAYLTLWNRWSRNWQVKLLGRWKQELY